MQLGPEQENYLVGSNRLDGILYLKWASVTPQIGIYQNNPHLGDHNYFTSYGVYMNTIQ